MEAWLWNWMNLFLDSFRSPVGIELHYLADEE